MEGNEAFEEFLKEELELLKTKLLAFHVQDTHVQQRGRLSSVRSVHSMPRQLSRQATTKAGWFSSDDLEKEKPPRDVLEADMKEMTGRRAVYHWHAVMEKLGFCDPLPELDPSLVRPSKLQVRPRIPWQFTPRLTLTQDSMEGRSSTPEEELREVIVKSCADRSKFFVLHPDGWAKFAWGIAVLLVVLWDALTLPLHFFDLGSVTKILDGMNVVMLFFWAVDMPISCFTAVNRDGVLDFRPRACIHDYLRSWCFPDALLILTDVTVTIVGSDPDMAAVAGTQSFRASRVARLSRLLRLLRLVRLFKASAAVAHLVDYIRSPLLVVLVSLLKLTILILFVNHYIACAWCALAYFNESNDSWAHQHSVSSDNFLELYPVSLHWSLTQFTPSTQDIAPSNILERMFAAAVVVFALLVFSSFVSSITNQMNQIRTWNAKNIQTDAALRQFLHARQISTQLGIRITNFFKLSQKQKMQTPMSSMPFLANLPDSLKIRLHSEIYWPAFTTSGLFSRVLHIDEPLLNKICSDAFKEHYSPPECVFLEGASAKGVLVVNHGELTYQCLNSTARPSPGQWIAEAALWCYWSFAGSLQAETAADLFLLESEPFSRVCQTYGGPLVALLRRIAVLFMDYLEEACNEPITDMPLKKETWKDMLHTSYKLEKMSMRMWSPQFRGRRYLSNSAGPPWFGHEPTC
ncbi:unnamed protein product [Effrenium voratum]|uniref:Cyclic nucleotide-binding domain-containing protein n=1 Tax=Effrenium voratum TaxID=2562239 RepID=A0AA36J497_9DINO|nr:unnamed protein product [Effrenium voratum]CAJ1421776.1 unnamed protein product [Effrenium voratum]